MTANVSIEVARNDDVLRVPNAALRFRPTAELFAALGQPMPASFEGGAPAPTAGRLGDPARERPAQPATATRGAWDGAASHGRVWVLRDGRLEAVGVRLGVTDGTITAVLAGDLAEGAQVVTGTTTRASARAPETTGSPLLPFGGRPPGARQSTPVAPSPGGRR
jgi:HlyD family secretion protein